MPPFRVAALEFPVRYGDVAHALATVDSALESLAANDPPDLVLLPEASLTGYVSPRGDFDLRRFAEAHDGPTANALAGLAAKHRIALAGPLIERDGRRYYNALLLFDRTGLARGHWRKRHPWVPEQWASRGNLGTPVVDLDGVRVSAGICFDLHFLPDEASESLASSDVFLFPSAWVEHPPETRPALLADLARDFELVVVNANWGPSVPRLPGQGGSMILDANARVLARATAGGGLQVVRADVEIAQTHGRLRRS